MSAVNRYIEYARALQRFNDWELRYESGIPATKRLERFFILMEAGSHLAEDVQERGHREHLQNLISIQQELMRAHEKTKKPAENTKNTKNKKRDIK